MKVQTSQVTKVVLTELDNLDPVTVILEDFGPGQGKVIIECFGESWSSFWPAMGNESIREFITTSNNSYLTNKLAPALRDRVEDYDNLDAWLKTGIINRRKEGELTKEVARKLWGDVDDHCQNEEMWLASDDGRDLAFSVYGEEWWYDLPMVSNHKYEYLDRIVSAVKSGLKDPESSLSPRSAHSTGVLSFSKALELMEEGKRVKRQGWDTEVWLFRPEIGNSYFCHVDTSKDLAQPGWAPTQQDMTAKDWLDPYPERVGT